MKRTGKHPPREVRGETHLQLLALFLGLLPLLCLLLQVRLGVCGLSFELELVEVERVLQRPLPVPRMEQLSLQLLVALVDLLELRLRLQQEGLHFRHLVDQELSQCLQGEGDPWGANQDHREEGEGTISLSNLACTSSSCLNRANRSSSPWRFTIVNCSPERHCEKRIGRGRSRTKPGPGRTGT